MKIAVLCSDPKHPVVRLLIQWLVDMRLKGHETFLAHDEVGLSGGDILFLVSCTQLISSAERARYKAVLVLHASDLPRGRGWSPHVWDILNGANEITVCLLEASDPVDSGQIWLRRRFTLEGHELLDEINAKLFAAELEMMTLAVEQYSQITPEPQQATPEPYLRRRTPEDSRLYPDKTLAQQFDLLRVVDSERFPAFMDFRNRRYLIKIEKVDGNSGK